MSILGDQDQIGGLHANHDEKPDHVTMQDIRFINKSIQLVLRQAVDRLGWSDSEVAHKADLPQSTVYRLLNAKTANPSYSLVYTLCQVLGIALPLSDASTQLTAPIDYFIGSSSLALIRQGRKTESVHTLPELQKCKIGKVIDDCADRKYPKNSLLFIEAVKNNSYPFKPSDTAIVRISKNDTSYILMPMMVLTSPIHNEWALHHLTSQSDKQFIVNFTHESLTAKKYERQFEIIGRVHKALI